LELSCKIIHVCILVSEYLKRSHDSLRENYISWSNKTPNQFGVYAMLFIFIINE